MPVKSWEHYAGPAYDTIAAHLSETCAACNGTLTVRTGLIVDDEEEVESCDDCYDAAIILVDQFLPNILNKYGRDILLHAATNLADDPRSPVEKLIMWAGPDRKGTA